jgi:hypothetical protein
LIGLPAASRVKNPAFPGGKPRVKLKPASALADNTENADFPANPSTAARRPAHQNEILTKMPRI